MRRFLFGCFVVACGSLSWGAETWPTRVPPRETGYRTVVLDVTVDEAYRPTAIDSGSSEAPGLTIWAKATAFGAKLKPNSPGVVKIAERKHQVTLRFPVHGDGPLCRLPLRSQRREFNRGPNTRVRLPRPALLVACS